MQTTLEEIRHKFLLASESDVNEITDSDFPKELEVIPLHGHFFDMVGIRTPMLFFLLIVSVVKALWKNIRLLLFMMLLNISIHWIKLKLWKPLCLCLPIRMQRVISQA